jgi:hypothetical protein
MKTSRIAAVTALVFVLATTGCSRIQFGYGQAERVIAWTLESYLPLDKRQSAALASQLTEFKQWHCRTQVTGYAAWLRQVGAELPDGVTPEQVAARFANVRHFGRVMAEEASPRLAALARSLDDRQLDELALAMDKSNAKFRREFVDVAHSDAVARRATRARERLEFWSGPLTREQRQVVERWSVGLEPAQAETLGGRERWQKRLRNALARRDDTERLRGRLYELMTEPERSYPPALVEKLEANRARTYTMIAEVASLMTDQQRRHLTDRTATMAKDFEAVACPPPVRSAAAEQAAIDTGKNIDR